MDYWLVPALLNCIRPFRRRLIATILRRLCCLIALSGVFCASEAMVQEETKPLPYARPGQPYKIRFSVHVKRQFVLPFTYSFRHGFEPPLLDVPDATDKLVRSEAYELTISATPEVVDSPLPDDRHAVSPHVRQSAAQRSVTEATTPVTVAVQKPAQAIRSLSSNKAVRLPDAPALQSFNPGRSQNFITKAPQKAPIARSPASIADPTGVTPTFLATPVVGDQSVQVRVTASSDGTVMTVGLYVSQCRLSLYSDSDALQCGDSQERLYRVAFTGMLKIPYMPTFGLRTSAARRSAFHIRV